MSFLELNWIESERTESSIVRNSTTKLPHRMMRERTKDGKILNAHNDADAVAKLEMKQN